MKQGKSPKLVDDIDVIDSPNGIDQVTIRTGFYDPNTRETLVPTLMQIDNKKNAWYVPAEYGMHLQLKVYYVAGTCPNIAVPVFFGYEADWNSSGRNIFLDSTTLDPLNMDTHFCWEVEQRGSILIAQWVGDIRGESVILGGDFIIGGSAKPQVSLGRSAAFTAYAVYLGIPTQDGSRVDRVVWAGEFRMRSTHDMGQLYTSATNTRYQEPWLKKDNWTW